MKIKSRLNSGNACYHAVQSLWFSHMLSKNAETDMFKAIILLVLYGRETWPLTLWEEHRVYDNRVLWGIFGAKGRRQQEAGMKCMRSPTVSTLPQI
jgi:hypothetical protein